MKYIEGETTQYVTSGTYQRDTKSQQNKISLLLPDFINAYKHIWIQNDTKYSCQSISVSLATFTAIF
jgi:hypothetical protein